MIFSIMVSNDEDKLFARLDIIKSFTKQARSLTIYQLWKMCDEFFDITLIRIIVEDLRATGFITQSGWTKCQWTGDDVETFHYEEKL